jgi:hypothetical protein
VTVTDTKCSPGGTAFKRTYITNEKGTLANPGLSASTYDLCASATISGTARRVKATGVAVTALAGVSKTLTLSTTAEAGTCP